MSGHAGCCAVCATACSPPAGRPGPTPTRQLRGARPRCSARPPPVADGRAGRRSARPARSVRAGGPRSRLTRAGASCAAGAWRPGPDLFGWAHGPGRGRADPRRPGRPATAGDRRGAGGGSAAAARRGPRRCAGRVHLRHVDAGSDGSEEWEILALLGPVYDIHRLGIFFTASPRHADVLLVTGAGARGMAGPLRAHLRRHARSQGRHRGRHRRGQRRPGQRSPTRRPAGSAARSPVDVWLPGSPPSPFGILHALLLALGRLPAAEGARDERAVRGRADPAGAGGRGLDLLGGAARPRLRPCRTCSARPGRRAWPRPGAAALAGRHGPARRGHRLARRPGTSRAWPPTGCPACSC